MPEGLARTKIKTRKISAVKLGLRVTTTTIILLSDYTQIWLSKKHLRLIIYTVILATL